MNESGGIPDDLAELDAYIRSMERTAGDIYPGARAQVVWTSEARRKTPLSLVYLHGFRATHQEGEPVHVNVARSGPYNLYLARHIGHGMEDILPLRDLKADHLRTSARKAIEIGLRLGEQVILMGTSTGGSMALWLAGLPEYRDRIAALVLYAPLIDFTGWARILKMTLPRNALRLIPGSGYPLTDDAGSAAESRIWYDRYAMQGAVALGEFVQKHMTAEQFRKVRQPVFTGYCEKDQVVSVPAIKKMFSRLGTPPDQRVIHNFAGAGHHVICSELVSGAVREVERSTLKFLEMQQL